MDQRIPAILHPLLQETTRRLEQELPGLVTALYLEGSVALDSFHPRLSDVDFIAVLSRVPTREDADTLLRIHQTIEQQYPQWKLSGMYFQPGDLGCADQTRDPFLQYHDGKLKESNHFALSSVTWWIIKQRGITLFGPPAQELDISVDMQHLLQVQHENMNTYWASFTTRLDGRLALLSNWGIEWTVLGVLRQFYTLREQQITSKVQAGEYALACLPERWHRLIREALALRAGAPKSLYRSRLARALDAYRFLKYTIRTCNDSP